MGACLIALCGGKELVSVHFSQCLPLCPFGLRYHRHSDGSSLQPSSLSPPFQDAVLWTACCLHVCPLRRLNRNAPCSSNAGGQAEVSVRGLPLLINGVDHDHDTLHREEIALYGLFEYITEMLERMIEQPTSSLPFALTFLCLATATPSIFRFAPALRLATALERLGAYQLLFCIYLPPPSRLFTGSDANAVDAHASRMIEVLRNVVANKNFGQTQELCLE